MPRGPQFVYSELLVMRCQAGEREALASLVELWQPMLRRQALQLCDNEAMAMDVLQDCWLAVVGGISRLQDPASFPAWAMQILRNKAANAVAGRQRERHRNSGEQPTESETARSADSPDSTVLRQAIRELPAEQRELLLLHYIEGFSMHQIAGLLAIPPGTVKSRLFNSRRMLRNLINGDDND